MGVPVDVYTWPEIAIAGGEEVTLVHWVVNATGGSLIQPDRWYWMSGVPDYHDIRPDRPVSAAALEALVQGPVRERTQTPGPGNTNWRVTWRNPGSDPVWFQPRMVGAPAL